MCAYLLALLQLPINLYYFNIYRIEYTFVVVVVVVLVLGCMDDDDVRVFKKQGQIIVHITLVKKSPCLCPPKLAEFSPQTSV